MSITDRSNIGKRSFDLVLHRAGGFVHALDNAAMLSCVKLTSSLRPARNSPGRKPLSAVCFRDLEARVTRVHWRIATRSPFSTSMPRCVSGDGTAAVSGLMLRASVFALRLRPVRRTIRECLAAEQTCSHYELEYAERAQPDPQRSSP